MEKPHPAILLFLHGIRLLDREQLKVEHPLLTPRIGICQALCRMKNTSLLIASFLALGSASRTAVAADVPGNTLACNIGPVTRSYGGGQWLVYGCSDSKSIILVTAQGNPGFPFVFSFICTSKAITLHGEGAGDEQATDAAFRAFKALGQADVAMLFQRAKAHAGADAGARAT